MSRIAYLRELQRCQIASCTTAAEVELVMLDGQRLGRYCRPCGEAMLKVILDARRHPGPLELTPEGFRRQGSGESVLA